jgi:putative redox protein
MANEARVVLQTVTGPEIQFQGTVPNGGTITLDSGKDVDEASPVETMLVALGACGGMDVIGILRKKRQVVLGYEVLVRGERRDEHPRIFTRIEVVHRLRGRNLNPAAVEEAIRLSDTTYCTVHAIMAASATIESRFEIVPA